MNTWDLSKRVISWQVLDEVSRDCMNRDLAEDHFNDLISSLSIKEATDIILMEKAFLWGYAAAHCVNSAREED